MVAALGSRGGDALAWRPEKYHLAISDLATGTTWGGWVLFFVHRRKGRAAGDDARSAVLLRGRENWDDVMGHFEPCVESLVATTALPGRDHSRANAPGHARTMEQP